MSTPGAIVIPAVTRHTATVILAHGLGDSGAGWSGIAQNYRRRSIFNEVAFIFPNAPTIPISVNWNMRMPGWYDITSFDEIASGEDEPGILKSRDYFHKLIRDETEQKGIPSERIVIGGFSQGGAISIFSGLTCPTKLGGIFGLSSYLLLRNKIKDIIPDDEPNKDTEIFMGHGEADLLVKFEWGKQTAKTLKEMGYKVNFHSYPGLEHSANLIEMDDLEEYLQKVIPPIAEREHSEL